MRAAAALLHLAEGRYRDVAEALLAIPPELVDVPASSSADELVRPSSSSSSSSAAPAIPLASILHPDDLAGLLAVTSLATFSRQELRDALTGPEPTAAPGKALLEGSPALRDALTDFVNGKYAPSLSALQRLSNESLRLDPHLANHCDTLMSAITERALTQYLAPYTSVDLAAMAQAFHMPLPSLDAAVAGLIKGGAVRARIDVSGHSLQGVTSDPRSGAIAGALGAAKTFSSEARVLLLRTALVRAGLSIGGGSGGSGGGMTSSSQSHARGNAGRQGGGPSKRRATGGASAAKPSSTSYSSSAAAAAPSAAASDVDMAGTGMATQDAGAAAAAAADNEVDVGFVEGDMSAGEETDGTADAASLDEEGAGAAAGPAAGAELGDEVAMSGPGAASSAGDALPSSSVVAAASAAAAPAASSSSRGARALGASPATGSSAPPPLLPGAGAGGLNLEAASALAVGPVAGRSAPAAAGIDQGELLASLSSYSSGGQWLPDADVAAALKAIPLEFRPAIVLSEPT